MNLTETIKTNSKSMTKSESRVAAYFMAERNDFAFENLDIVAKKIDVSTTSVIRFCRKLGFSGYKEFQEEVKTEIRNNLTLPDKLLRSAKQDNGFSSTVQRAVDCIEKTFKNLSASQVNNAVKSIVNAQRVFCFGLKESFALAHYAYTRFLTVRSNVFMLSAGQNGEIESVLGLGEGDVCIFFLFHRYTKQSPEILKLLKEQGVSVILITSPPYDGVERFASVMLPCFVDINGIKNSSVAPVCIIDYLCNGAVSESGGAAMEYMKKSEQLFGKFVFGDNK